MYLAENIKLALEGLSANKMRALLTMLGIIIGISSVIAIVTVGDSMSASVSDSMQSLGAANIMVNLTRKDLEGGGGSRSAASGDLFTDEMLEKLVERYGDKIDAVSLNVSGGSGKVQEGSLYANVSVTGTNEGFAKANNVEMISGRYIRDGDNKAKRYVAVVSDKLVNNMFPYGDDPLGKEIKASVNDTIQTYTIVGVYKYEQNMLMTMGTQTTEKDIRTNMYIPISTCNMMISADEGYYSFTIMAAVSVDSTQFAEDITGFLNTYFYANNQRFEASAISMESMMSAVSSMMGTISIAVAVIAGISLIVGGIGVMNIMLVSVTERTREIGTRKALGARNSSVRAQFIVEAVIVCAIGGIIGVILGISLGYFASSLLGFAAYPSLSIIIIAVMFSMLIGVFFGYYPANKASKLDPIEALRYE